MKSLLSLTSFLGFAFIVGLNTNIYAQQVQYGYDLNGNRNAIISVSLPAMVFKPNTNPKPDSVAQKIAQANGLHVYPNPTQYSVSVAIDSVPTLNNTTTIYLLDVTGAILYTHAVTEWPYPIDMVSYAAGTYFVKVIIGNQKALFYRVLKSK
jgi:hypothetical protein